MTDAERLRMRVPPRRLPVMRQRWQHLAFLHWAVDPVALAALLPPSLELDTWQGQAFVGIVPFAIRGTRVPFLPPVPWLSNFNELNLRTYVHRRGQNPGVWFFSLDAASRLAVWGARATYKLPYFHASIALERSRDGVVSFSSRRSPGGRRRANGARPQLSAHLSAQPSVQLSCSYQPTSPPAEARPGTRDFFFVERYLLYSWDGRRLRSAQVAHRPYPLSSATVVDLSQNLAAAAGIDLDASRAPIAHYADGLDVRIYGPSFVKEGVRTPVASRVLPVRAIQELPVG